ncbi:hypothetical protein [uncultured Sphaerochaeta sp.]|uniref:hypothetical protein n=1 Tax=uncultured Sphaerochaeta sp. TaxID=886478 RepID=UPI002AA785DF|nr:hypothetical protein [uncultured Sphaerochaeta sp.]
MAGYIFNVGNGDKGRISGLQIIEESFNNGIFATKIKTQKNYWNSAVEGTFGDFLGMKENDNVYFFHQRKIYGIGKVRKIKTSVVHLNYPNADIPSPTPADVDPEVILLDQAEFYNYPVFFCFTPDPLFFVNGIDMDEALSSNPDAFRMLRANWSVSFIKVDDQENEALRECLLLANKTNLKSPSPTSQAIYPYSNQKYNDILSRISDAHIFNSYTICRLCHEGTLLKHEMAIEADIGYRIASGESHCIDIFGKWDHIAHQVIASPFKPISYMDKMDLFGYVYLENYPTIIEKYIIIEVKKDKTGPECLEQVMKYVDFVNNEYCHGDYSMIEAFCVAYEFSDEAKSKKDEIGKRIFSKGVRPSKTEIWDSLTLVEYEYKESLNKIIYEKIDGSQLLR